MEEDCLKKWIIYIGFYTSYWRYLILRIDSPEAQHFSKNLLLS